MVSTFINPVVNPDKPLGVNAFTETLPVRYWPNLSADERDGVVRAVYKQVLSNAYVMESERSQVLESQFCRGELSVMEFVRALAKSDLYRTRFFENGSRNRFIELNFKHLLGRAPENLAEVAKHSAILDSKGYEAEIDSYIDSDEYYQTFGVDTVPYYRGYKTEASTPAGFTHMFSLLRGASGSDKELTRNNPARLLNTLFADQASSVATPSWATNRKGIGKNWSADQILASVFSQPTFTASANTKAGVKDYSVSPFDGLGDSELAEKVRSQADQIEQLTEQLSNLRSLSNMGAAILRSAQSPSDASDSLPVSNGESVFSNSEASLESRAKAQAKEIEKLQGELMSARSLATIAEFKLNRWRSRSF
ncbi:MAG: phycobilisome rod-core linker polypeptide [Cyanobacteria bacterium J06632_3]